MKLQTKTLGFLLVAVSLASCLPKAGDATVDANKDGVTDSGAGGVRGIDTVTQQAPSSPVGVVFGSFVNGYTGAAIANLPVKILTAKNVELDATTNASGSFQINAVAPGQFVITAKADGMIPYYAILTMGTNGFININAAPTDNTTLSLGTIHLLPTDATWSFSVSTEDGRPVPNATVYIDLPSALIDARVNNLSQTTTQDLGNFLSPSGIFTITATTSAAGVATVTGVFNPQKLFEFVAGTTGTQFNLVQAIVGSQDLDNPPDGVMDAAGSIGAWTSVAFANANSKVALPPLTALVDGQNAFAPVTAPGNSATVLFQAGGTPLEITRAIGTSEPIVIIFNQPVDLNTVDFTVINDWSNKRNLNILDNSTPVVAGQGFPVAAAAYQTKPVGGGAQTLVPSTDPSGTILTLTPSVPWAAGAEYWLTGQLSSLRHSQSQAHVFSFSSRAAGFRTLPAAALAITKVFVERDDGADKYNNLVIMLSEVTTVYQDNTGGPYILVCAEQDFGTNGRETTAANGTVTLDAGECPDATYQLRGTDIGVGIVKATLRVGPAGELLTNSGRFFNITPQSINAALSSQNSVKLRVLVNPIVDGQPYAGLTPGGQTTGTNFMSNTAGNAYTTTVLTADITVAPASSNVQLELPTNNAAQFE